jgi:hypothetical protein
MIYEWKRNMPVKAQTAGEHLEKLERKHGQLSPKLIVEDSRPEGATLHKCFEWNDDIAAEKYRENQARFILQNLVTVSVKQMTQNEQSEVRAFVNVTKAEERAYVSINAVMNDTDMRSELLRTALAELAAFKKKYQQLKELAEVFKVVDRLEA